MPLSIDSARYYALKLARSLTVILRSCSPIACHIVERTSMQFHTHFTRQLYLNSFFNVQHISTGLFAVFSVVSVCCRSESIVICFTLPRREWRPKINACRYYVSPFLTKNVRLICNSGGNLFITISLFIQRAGIFMGPFFCRFLNQSSEFGRIIHSRAVLFYSQGVLTCTCHMICYSRTVGREHKFVLMRDTNPHERNNRL